MTHRRIPWRLLAYLLGVVVLASIEQIGNVWIRGAMNGLFVGSLLSLPPLTRRSNA